MDPCPFVRILIGNLALSFPQQSHDHLSFYSKFKLRGFPSQLSHDIPFTHSAVDARIHACFTLSKSELEKLAGKPSLLKVEVYSRRRSSNGCCGRLVKKGKLLGCVSLQLDLKSVVDSNRACLVHNGWAPVRARPDAKLHLNVRAEPDARFVFQFDGEPECSPQVFQINGNVRQPVFTCNFSFRNCSKRNPRSRSSISTSEAETTACCFGFGLGESDDVEVQEQRKGWSITIHDLSGSPVAAASMVTPFVPPSPGADRVGKSNPGAWLILRPGYSAWKPWGRLEAWRESSDVCYRFELIPDGGGGGDAIPLANSKVSTKNGGKFSIDVTTSPTPMASPSSSFDFSSGCGSCSEMGSASGSGSWAHLLYRGFVMSSTVGGGGRPEVEVGVQHVTCTEDAAAFVALAAAMDLSMDACKLFSEKLRRELRQPDLG